MKLDLKAMSIAIAESEKSQVEIAKVAGLNTAHLSRVVTGLTKPNRSTIGKIARALEVPVEAIIKDD